MAYLFMLKQLWHYAGDDRPRIVIYYLLHAVSILGELGKPYAFAMVVNSLQANRPTLIADVSHWLGFYVLCYFTFRVLHISARYIELPVAFRCRRRFVDDIYDRLQSLPLSWHTEHHSGNIIDRVNVAARALHEFGQAQMCYIPVAMQFWGPLIILWKISPPISVVSLVVGIAMVAITRKLYNRIVPLYRGAIGALHEFAAAFYDYMSNMKTIVTLRLGRHVKQDLDRRLALAFPFIMKEQNVTQVKCVTTSFLTLALEVGLVFYYIWARKQAGTVIMIGSVTAIFQYLGLLVESFGFYVGDYEKVIHWKADLEAIRPVMEATPLPHPADGACLTEWRHIDVHPISFSHDGNRQHLRSVTLRLTRGGRIAIVGESGSGKSTVLNVLRGLSPIPGALLTVDNDGSALLSALSDTTTLVPQEPEVFENTLRHNITMGIPASEDEIRTAVRVAGLEHVISSLPYGLDTDIREKGVNLSGGERQRLALARGVFAIRDSTIVLFDEPTSNIDPRTETVIFQRLFERLDGKCIVSSLHRLHLVRLFDYVYVMKQGRIVEQGTFTDLCHAGGEFARLWEVYQAGTQSSG